MREPLILLSAIAAAGCGAPGDTTLVAEAAGYELSVNEAVDLLVGVSGLPNEADVVRTLGNLWVDYILLAEAARRDSSLASVDVEPLVQQQVERRVILQLRDTEIQVDTAVTESDLRSLYDAERPGMGVNARHILLTVPEDATAEQEDSVRRRAADLRERAAADPGAFEALAREYSQDPGTARLGGELGLLEPGQVLPAIGEAVFDLAPGEVSDVVETDYGLHIFRVDARQEPSFEETSDELRTALQERRLLEAESTYIADMLDRSSVRILPEAAELTRRMAEQAGDLLAPRAARRAVAEYEGGELSLEEVADFMRTGSREYRQQVAEAPDDVVEQDVLTGLVQRELLLQRALDGGFSVPAAERDSLAGVARERFADAARELGLLRLTPSPGRSPRETVETRVVSILEDMLAERRDVVPLGAIGYALRRQYSGRLFESGVEQVVRRLEDGGGGGEGGG